MLVLPCTTCFAESSISPARSNEPSEETPQQSTELTAQFEALDIALQNKDADSASAILAFLKLVNKWGALDLLPADFYDDLSAAHDRCADASPDIAEDAHRALVLFAYLNAALLNDELLNDELTEARLRASPRVRYICTHAWSFERIGEGLRRAAARAMMFYEPDTATAIAVQWLDEDNTALQAEAARMCADLKLSKYASRLERRADDEDLPLDLRLEYAFASHRLGGAGIHRIRSALLSASSPVAVRFRCLAMLELAGQDAAANTLLQLLDDEAANPDMAARAIRTLGMWGVSQLALRLDRYLKSSSLRLRLAAVEATGHLKASRLTPRIALIIERGADARLEAAAILCLKRLGAKEYVILIGERLYSQEFAVRLEAALALQSLEEKDFGLKRDMDAVLQQNIIQKVRVWWQKRITNNP